MTLKHYAKEAFKKQAGTRLEKNFDGSYHISPDPTRLYEHLELLQTGGGM